MKQMMDRGVAVIIPYFNGADYISTAVQSVLNQTVLPDEIIIIDDGSDEPLVRISFSPSILEYLDGRHIDVAKSMMDAGIQTVFEINEERAPESDTGDGTRPTLH